MSDLAVRLRCYASQENCDGPMYDDMQQAGEEIEQLRAENERLKTVIRRVCGAASNACLKLPMSREIKHLNDAMLQKDVAEIMNAVLNND